MDVILASNNCVGEIEVSLQELSSIWVGGPKEACQAWSSAEVQRFVSGGEEILPTRWPEGRTMNCKLQNKKHSCSKSA